MLLNRITMTEFSIFKCVFALPFLGLLNAFLNPYVSLSLFSSHLHGHDLIYYFSCLISAHDELVFHILLVTLLCFYAHMVLGVIDELCTHLNIRTFHIVPKDQTKKN